MGVNSNIEKHVVPSVNFLRRPSARFQPDWLLAQTFMGITTFYKLDPDGSLWIKMHGTMDDVGIMDQLATVREVDLFNTWVPFCNTSSVVTRLGIVELIAYFSVSLPGVGRWVPCRTSGRIKVNPLQYE